MVAFERHADGRLTQDETVATGGLGTSAGLGDQAAIAITGDEEHLLAVNAGSDNVSLFDIEMTAWSWPTSSRSGTGR